MSKPGIAIILFTVREPASQDLDGTLAKVREAGFEYVQWSGMPPMPAEDAKAALDRAGLKAIAAHCPMEPFEEDFEGQVAYWHKLGLSDVAPGGMMRDCLDTLDAWKQGCQRLDTIGARLKARNMRLSYHNHDWEFTRFDGDDRCKLDLLYEETGATNLYAELDVCWVHAGGQDPAAYIRKYASRCPVIHVKDMKTERHENGMPMFTPLGDGCLDWPAIFAAAEESGVEWCVYEQDTHEGDLFEAVKRSYDFLHENLG